MAMPSSLVLIRHGQSEGNVIQKAMRASGDDSFPDEYLSTPDREVRLSPLGVLQTQKTGEYLKLKYPEGFDIIYSSDHTRAKETAALVCLAAGWDSVKISVDPQLGERNWGNFHNQDSNQRRKILNARKRDPLHVPMPDGETLLEARTRTRVFLERCHRQHERQKVLVFTHGEYIEAIWSEIAHMRTEQQIPFFSGPLGDIKNCQVVEFENRSTLHVKSKMVKTSNPHLGEFGDWISIEDQVMTPAELLAEVETYPHMEKVKNGTKNEK